MTTYFSPFAQPVAAASSGGTTIVSKGMRVLDNPDGSRAVSLLPTFQKWDGTDQLISSLDFASGNWPYQVQQDTASLTISRLSQSFTQTRVPGASYQFLVGSIKETITLRNARAFPAGVVDVPLSTNYQVLISQATVQLLDIFGNVAWETTPYEAWDSSPIPQVFPSPILAASYSKAAGLLTLVLNPNMLADATYPLYLDPTWTWKADANNVWPGTLDHVTSDWGDHNLKIGYKADNFDGNVNVIWAVQQGTFTVSGGQGSLGSNSIIKTSGSWTNIESRSTVTIGDSSHDGQLSIRFRYVDEANHYALRVSTGAGSYIRFYKYIGGTQTYISPQVSFTISKNTSYDVRIVAKGNYFEAWWNGVMKWNGTDASPPGSPLSSGVGFNTTSAAGAIVDNVRVWAAGRTYGNFSSAIRDAGTSNVPTQIKFLGSADGYNSTDLWINSSADNTVWGGWHVAKSMAAPGFYYQVPDIDQRRYYQVRAMLRSGNSGTPAVSEIDSSENPPAAVAATTNTGGRPWYFFVAGAVNAVSGNLYYRLADLSIQAKGLPIAIARAYNSRLSANSGPFGLGATHNFNVNLTFPTGGNVTLNDGDGATFTFVTMGGNYYGPPRGLHYNLIKNGDGTYALWRPDGSKMNFDSTGKLTAIADKNGNQLTLTYTSGKLTQVADGSGLSLAFTYDASNRISTITDPMGRKVSYTYDGSSRLTQFKDPMGFTENYTYDASNRLTQRVDRAGHVDRFVYDGSSRVSELWQGEWNYAGGSIRWQFRAYALNFVAGNETDVTNAEGAVTKLYFNSMGNPILIGGPSVGGMGGLGNSTRYSWDGEFDPLTTTDGRGNIFSNNYDWMGNIIATTDPGGNITTRAFTNIQSSSRFISLLVAVTNPRAYTTNFTYDTSGNLVTTRDAAGLNTSYNYYDAAGSLIRAQDFRGNSTRYGYDSHEFLINTTDPGGNVTTFQNDPIGRRWNATTPGGNTSRTVYDADGRVNETIDPMGNITNYNYNNRGERIRVRDANLLVTQYVINITLGARQKVIDAGGNTTTYAYNNTGNLLQVTDANNHATTYGYDIYHRQTKVTSPLGYATKFGYDAAGNQIWRIDANGNKTNSYYDRSNRRLKTAYPNGQVLTTTFDKNGNVVDKKGLEIEEKYAHDKLDRVTATQEIFLTTTLTLYHNYTNDANGNRLSMDGDGGGTYTWDRSNRMYSQANRTGARWTYAYDKDGHRLKVTYPDGETATYQYNRNGWILSTTSKRSNGGVIESFTYTYDRIGNRLSMQEPGSNPTSYVYDKQYRLSKVTYPNGTLETFAYDAVGNRVSHQKSLYYTLRPNGNGGTIQWSPFGCTYDYQCVNEAVSNGDTNYVYASTIGNTDLYTLPSLPDIGSQPIDSVTVYAVARRWLMPCPPRCLPTSGSTDAIYLRVNGYRSGSFGGLTSSYATYSATWTTNPATGQPWTVSAVNTLQAGVEVADIVSDAIYVTQLYVVVQVSKTNYSYDADNRLTSSTDGWSYTYDYNGNLRTATKTGQKTTYGYDYENRLTSVALPVGTTVQYGYSSGGLRTSLNPGGGLQIQYYGYDLVGLGGPPQITGQYLGATKDSETVFGVGTDRPLEMIKAGAGYYYHRDGLGSVTSLTDGGQNIVATYRYDPFGGQAQASGSVSSNYRFTGRELDASAGLAYYRTRYYAPTMGRFTSKDPSGMADGTDLYTYAMNNPLTLVDHTGAAVCVDGGGGPMGTGSGTGSVSVPISYGSAGGSPSTAPTGGSPSNGGGGGGGAGGAPPSGIDYGCVLSKIFDSQGAFSAPTNWKDVISCTTPCIFCYTMIKGAAVGGWALLAFWVYDVGLVVSCLACGICLWQTASEILNGCVSVAVGSGPPLKRDPGGNK